MYFSVGSLIITAKLATVLLVCFIKKRVCKINNRPQKKKDTDLKQHLQKQSTKHLKVSLKNRMGTWISQREDDWGDGKTKAALYARWSDECNGITFTNWSPKSLQTIVLIGIKHPECINETRIGVYRRCGCCGPSVRACGRTVWCVRAKPLGVLTGSVTSFEAQPSPSCPAYGKQGMESSRTPHTTYCILRTRQQVRF